MTMPDPWDDDRLGAAFGASDRRRSTPPDLVSGTLAALGTPRVVVPVWRRLLAPAAVLVVAVVGLGGGLALIGSPGGSSGLVEFRRGPTAELRTLDALEFTFDFPADWLAYAAPLAGSGGSSIAVLGTQPIEPRCGDKRQVDVNCVFEQPLEPGQIRVFVGTGGYRGGSVLDRPDIENGSTTRLTIGGMPAILDEFDPQPDSFYREDVSLQWSIGRPATLTNVIRIELRAREWPVRGRVNTAAEVQAATQVLVDSFRFTPPPTLLPSDAAAATEAARAAIRTEADAFARGYLGSTDTTEVTYLDCLGDEPDVTATTKVSYGPGGYLGGAIDLACTWTIRIETPAIWRLDLTYDWTVDGRTGRYVESHWIDAASRVLAGTTAGQAPPELESRAGPAELFRLEVMLVATALEVRDAGADDRELAVRGWFSPIGPISCTPPATTPPATRPVSPLEPNCPDQWVVLMDAPESLVTVTDGGFEGRLPTGSFFQIDLDDLDRGWQPGLPTLGPAEPVEIVVIGHFDDRRSALCPDEVEAACRNRFVVDRVAWVDGVEQPTSLVTEVEELASTQDGIGAVVRNESPDGLVLSTAVVDGSTGIGRIEPSLGTGRGGFIDQRAIWVVRVLEGDRAVTYLVVDGTDAIFEMRDDGVPVSVGGSLPAPSEAPWPPDGATIVVLKSQVGSGEPPARVAVVDRSGRLSSVREVLASDPPIVTECTDACMVGPVDGRYRLVWTAGVLSLIHI